MKTKIELIGGDANLETSLIEYGLAWHQLGDEFTFIYGVEVNESCEYIAFDECTLNANNFAQDFDWIDEEDWQSVHSYIGLDPKGFDALPFEQKIESLLSYFGTENIFGSSYGNVMSFDELSEKYDI